MPLEKANTLSELDMLYPLPSDPSSRGDDHLRLIKTVLKKQFPGKDGNGLNAPITLTEEFLNGLPKAIQDLQKNMDGRWPIGSLLLLISKDDPQKIGFPGVWAKISEDATIHANLKDETVGTYVGDNIIDAPLPQHSHTATFSGNPLPPHSHQYNDNYVAGTVGPSGDGDRKGPRATSSVSAGTPSGDVSIGNAGTSNAKIDVRGRRLLVNIWRRVS